MIGIRLLVASVAFLGCFTTIPACLEGEQTQGTPEDRASLTKTDDAIHAAFARGDVDGVLAYHNRDVVKALSPGSLLVGRDAVKRNLQETFRATRLEFKESHVESVVFLGDSAVEISSFVIHGTPKNGGADFLFKGRAMVVYVRSKESPTGWASIREVIQPAP